MKSKNIILFLLVIAIIAGGVYTAFNGLKIGNFSISPIKDSIKLGLDIKGGVYVVLEADTNAQGEELDKIMDQTIEVIRKRVDALGLTEPNILKEGDNRIRIELPGVKNAEEAIAQIGQTAQLQFKRLNDEALEKLLENQDFTFENITDVVREYGEVVLTGKDVSNSELGFHPETNEPIVTLELNKEGAEAFRVATKELSALADEDPSKRIFIFLDKDMLSAPAATQEIPNGQAYITGEFTAESASTLAALIRGGALPVDLIEVQTSAQGPTLGIDSLKTSLNAAYIGITLVLLFMIFYYRIPGIVASIALILYTLIVLYVFVGLNATLTLPGVAGLILSIGMAVDANVIIFERIKEELRNGKTIRSSIESGFSKAIKTIMDSNITTLIAAVVLYNFGLGQIKGFAITLMIGIITSLFTAVVITKYLLKTIVNMGISKNTKFYGV